MVYDGVMSDVMKSHTIISRYDIKQKTYRASYSEGLEFITFDFMWIFMTSRHPTKSTI